jgi:hypothetical protein
VKTELSTFVVKVGSKSTFWAKTYDLITNKLKMKEIQKINFMIF